MFNFTLTFEQFHAMRTLIDLGVKTAGLGAVTVETLVLREMIETAQPVEKEKDAE